MSARASAGQWTQAGEIPQGANAALTRDRQDCYCLPPMSGRPDEVPARGESAVWSILSTLVAGPVVWGSVGYGADVLLQGSRSFLTPAGIVLGAFLSFYVVYVRYGRESPAGMGTRSRQEPRLRAGNCKPTGSAEDRGRGGAT